MRTRTNQFQQRTGEQDIFRAVTLGRRNPIFEFFIGLVLVVSSFPSFIVEVFLRKKFGERHYTTFTAIAITFFMFWFYFATGKQMRDYLGVVWLVFAIAFLVQSIRHRLEIRKFGSTYHFDRYSYSDGEILPFWWGIIGREYYGVKISQYIVHVILEPGLPFLAGVVLVIIPFTNSVGVLIIFSSIMYSFRNFIKTHIARGKVLDKLDEQIIMEAMHDVLVEEKPKSETKGLSLPIELPLDRELREDLCSSFESDIRNVWNDDFEEDRELVLA